MSPKSAVRYYPKKRREIIRENILFNDYEQLAKMCGVSKRTIIRDINKWRQEGGFEEFLLKEFFYLYGNERVKHPSRALDRIVMLLTKGMQQQEVLAQVDEIRLKWQENEGHSDMT